MDVYKELQDPANRLVLTNISYFQDDSHDVNLTQTNDSGEVNSSGIISVKMKLQQSVKAKKHARDLKRKLSA